MFFSFENSIVTLTQDSGHIHLYNYEFLFVVAKSI